MERPVSLIIAAQRLSLSARFDSLLQMDEAGSILKTEDLQVAEVHGIAIMGSNRKDAVLIWGKAMLIKKERGRKIHAEKA
jgi:hypothetical protein